MTEATHPQNSRILIQVKDWPHPWPSQPGWRHYIFDSHQNGMDALGVIVRIGTTPRRKKILIDEAKFHDWSAAAGKGEIEVKRTVYPNKKKAE